jgi:outer membrane protein W
MKTMKRLSVLLIALILAAMVPSLSRAQEYPRRDSTMVFTPSNPNLIQKTSYEPFHNAWGVDVMLSNNGFGAGGFFRHEFTDVLSGFAQIAISDVKDDSEVEYMNPYTGQSYTPYKINRLLLIPVTFGMQYRLFKDDIVDNFRPYVSAGIGPSMIFVSPYSNPTQVVLSDGSTGTYYDQIDFFTSLKKGHFKYALGGYVGAGAYFGLDKGSLTGVSARYYFVPYGPGIESLQGTRIKKFGGFFITLNFGSLY